MKITYLFIFDGCPVMRFAYLENGVEKQATGVKWSVSGDSVSIAIPESFPLYADLCGLVLKHHKAGFAGSL